MLPLPSPTPFDITPLPVFPFVPGAAWWSALLITGLVALSFGALLALLRRRRRPQLNVYADLRAKLFAITSESKGSERLEKPSAIELSAALRRYLSLRIDSSIRPLSPRELSLAEERTPPGPLRTLLSAVRLIEEQAYAPSPTTTISTSLLFAAIEALDSHEQILSAPTKSRGGRA